MLVPFNCSIGLPHGLVATASRGSTLTQQPHTLTSIKITSHYGCVYIYLIFYSWTGSNAVALTLSYKQIFLCETQNGEKNGASTGANIFMLYVCL